MTEDEARTKWCPMVQVSIDGIGSRFVNNRGRIIKEGDKSDAKCIASDCMLWRWKYPGENDEQVQPQSDGWKPTHGHCGLAR